MTMRSVSRTAMALIGSLAIGQHAAAHHSFAAQYDATKPVTLTGTVKKVDWTNPHASFFIDVKDEGGAVTSWRLELGSPNMLIRYKFTRDTITVGETVTVLGFLARDNSHLANAKTIEFADGRVLSAGSSVDLGNTK